jgi:hypothetical protein
VIAAVWIILARMASKTKEASPYAQTVTTSLSREQVSEQVEESFPRGGLVLTSSWERSSPTDDRLELSGYYLGTGGGCLTYLVTGIVPGYLLIKYLMGRTEQVAVDFSALETTGEVAVRAAGLRGREKAVELVRKLASPESPVMGELEY